MNDLNPCPWCGGEVEVNSVFCNHGKRIITLNLKCKKCGTSVNLKTNFESNPYQEAMDHWNRGSFNGR